MDQEFERFEDHESDYGQEDDSDHAPAVDDDDQASERNVDPEVLYGTAADRAWVIREMNKRGWR